ncbi:MAG: Gfo/Idh/MocA family protein [Fimbriimonas sp.]
MAESLRWGIIATGGIAHQFARGLKVSKTGTLVASGSRSLEKAEAFAEKHGGKAYGSYEEVLADPEVEAVYIATPHHLHSEWTVKAAEAGKAILCEKPFTLNELEAQRTLDAIKDSGVFFMEAFMYRCAPQTIKLREILASEVIGSPRAIAAEFSFGAGRDWQNFRTDPAVGAGGLMDVGTYAVSMSRLVAGCEPIRAEYVANLEPGYDAYGSGCLLFPNNVTAHIASGIHLSMRNDVMIYGDNGRIHIAEPWKCSGGAMTVFVNGQDPVAYDLSITNDELYGYEADAVAEYLEVGECPHMTKADTLGNMRTLDMLRKSCGLTFAKEWTV